MTSGASVFLAGFGRAAVLAMVMVTAGATASTGCDALSSETPITCDGGTCVDGTSTNPDTAPTTSRCASAANPLVPPIACGPNDEVPLPNCGGSDAVSGCPSDSACMARVKPTGTTTSLRVGKFRLWSPNALISLQSIIVDPEVNPTCFDNGQDTYNWLMRVDTAANTVTMGGAMSSTDGGASYTFVNTTITSSTYTAICPNFVGNGVSSFDLSPKTSPITFTGDAFTSAPVDYIGMPIYNATVPGNVPVVLPLHNAFGKDIILSADKACIGSWTRADWCGPASGGWTTGGTLLAQITLEDADNVPIPQVQCRSLCYLLVNDDSKRDGDHCKRDATTGKIAEYGDSCVGGTGCKNAYWLSATFAAFAVNVSGP
jgi:hypothetical protein